MVTIVLVLLGEDRGVGDLSLFPSLGPVFWEKSVKARGSTVPVRALRGAMCAVLGEQRWPGSFPKPSSPWP